MTTKIEAHERNIGDIFSDLYQFEIPPYQRPYAWEEDQVRELLSDLLDAMDNRDASGGLYFLGSIVLVKLPTEARARVIDRSATANNTNDFAECLARPNDRVGT